MASKVTVIRVLAVLQAAYPRFQPPPQTNSVYAELLADIPDDVLDAAAKHRAATSKWFPSVAELRDAAGEIVARGAGVRSAEEAWINVQRAVQRFGWYGQPNGPENGYGWCVPDMLSDLEKRAVEGLGGWKTLCESDNAVADRAHFLKIYGNMLDREMDTAKMLPAVREVVGNLAAAMRMERAMLPGKDGDR